MTKQAVEQSHEIKAVAEACKIIRESEEGNGLSDEEILNIVLRIGASKS